MTREAELKPEQAAAAYELKNHISVSAGPGSGKTKVLVERYLHILRQHKLSIDQIVAITFTNRAANEMRERLRGRLNTILQSTEGDERRRWLGYKRTLDGAVITTIHGFCARLLREFPVEARVDPQFVLLDEHRTAMLVDAIVEEVLSEFISSGHIEVSRLTLGVGRGRLATALAQLYREARGQGLSFDELARKTAENHSTESDYLKTLSHLDQRVAHFLNFPKLSLKAAAKRDNFANSWLELRNVLATLPSHEALKDYCTLIENLREHRPDKRMIGDLSAEFDDLLWGDLNTRQYYSGALPQLCFDSFARIYALEVVNLLTRVHERLNEEKQKMSALDFDDLETRTLALLENPEVLVRAVERYKFFLVDEFQDTNALQRRLLEQLALSNRRDNANLFIVGDRKQSIYGFRGADVDVFREMTATLVSAGGEEKPLPLNFRSKPPLIRFFNHLFARLFKVPDDLPVEERPNLEELGYVNHESSEPKREASDTGPLVEFLVRPKTPMTEDPRAEQDLRLLDAQQLAGRINALMREVDGLKYSDIALLFRAMTQVHIYESTFRRANIPYQTVLGRGFYEREEITDLIQLLRFLDNKTDELALAAVLRSPLCGMSDNALLALRCGPRVQDVEGDPLRGFSATRSLYRALRNHREIAFISEDEHRLLDRAADLISRLISRRHHYSIEELLRFAVDESEYMTVIAANFDGAQRLANVQRLFTLAARFERSGTYLIRDFVRYVEEFEAIGSRESEGQIDEAANAVRLMTIHQAKGLEFPIVIIPDLQRPSRLASDTAFLLDRHHGLTLKVPDGRGRLVAGRTFSRFETRRELREHFESMRLLYVAATRAQDRLILSGATEKLSNLPSRNDSWLNWIWQALELGERTRDDVVRLSEGVELQLTLTPGSRLHETIPSAEREEETTGSSDSLASAFPLMQPVDADRERMVHRFSVTQLINYQRCPRQYYFDRVLRLPSADEMAVWNNAEAPEPPANLTATLKGAVIHRFCERYSPDEPAEDRLRQSFDEVVRMRQAELADRLVEIDRDAAIKELFPLAQNYLVSDVFRRVESARRPLSSNQNLATHPLDGIGLWSELSFRLRRPLGVVTGVIDKLLITNSPEGTPEVEIIDFKTNRLSLGSLGPHASRVQTNGSFQSTRSSPAHKTTKAQFAFDFEAQAPAAVEIAEPQPVDEILRSAAHDYQLQMQAYALAVRELLPSLSAARIRVTLHFLEPNIEFHLSDDLLAKENCEQVVDVAILNIVSASEPTHFPVKPAMHCRMCNFLRVCSAGREWARQDHPPITQITQIKEFGI